MLNNLTKADVGTSQERVNCNSLNEHWRIGASPLMKIPPAADNSGLK